MTQFSPDLLAQLAVEIHADNVAVGWWTDIQTGASTLPTRNRPEMLMLAVSEIAEAAEGAHGMRDDKLPHLPTYDVELADFVIRQLDQIGAEVSCGHEMPDWAHMPMTLVPALRAGSRNDRLMQLVMQVSMAMEHYRKGRIGPYVRRHGAGCRSGVHHRRDRAHRPARHHRAEARIQCHPRRSPDRQPGERGRQGVLMTKHDIEELKRQWQDAKSRTTQAIDAE